MSKQKMVTVDGEPCVRRKASRIGKSIAVFVPYEWLRAVGMKHGKIPEYFAITNSEDTLFVRPYYPTEAESDSHETP